MAKARANGCGSQTSSPTVPTTGSGIGRQTEGGRKRSALLKNGRRGSRRIGHLMQRRRRSGRHNLRPAIRSWTEATVSPISGPTLLNLHPAQERRRRRRRRQRKHCKSWTT
eukprot:5692949-Karenia_brevis.AAC.1